MQSKDEWPVRAIAAIGEAVSEVMDKRLAERDARLDCIEAQLELDARFRALVTHPLWRPALEAMATGEENAWQIADDIGCTVPELAWAVERWRRSWRR